ncbi:MAG: DUF3048 domain-containing protein [Pseudonocardiaceae bacterium]|nr:DUF3048 domain-containing protein [Pseudonocardiaceae bacterium]
MDCMSRCRSAVVAVLALLLAGCTAAPPSPPPAPPPVSPLTGLPTDLAAPVLIVKIDNVGSARPQTGLMAADLVYVEPVEGGVSRLAAVYQSQVPPVVGPVRSIRRTDLQLVANFGRPALAFSGQAPQLRPLIDQSAAVDVSAPPRPDAYSRQGPHSAPHNLYANARRLAPAGAPPVDIGFEFGPTPKGGQPVEATSVSYASTQIGIEWAPAQRRWVFTMDGTPLTAAKGDRPGAATVVLQRVEARPTDIADATGTTSSFARTVGGGEAVVLRNGHAVQGTWSRPAPHTPTTFNRPDGSPLPFASGPVWVVLVPAPPE